MAPPTTIVFGPAGSVGSAVARTLVEDGVKTVLALRSLEKPVPGLSAEQEKAAGVERVQADLTKPDTVKAAVQQTGAKRAFIYIAHPPPVSGMREAVEALKEGGIEFVVFLSSASVQEPLREIEPSDFIPFIHAQVELALLDVFGPEGYVALRPAYFNTNVVRWSRGIHAGEVRVNHPEFRFDWIAPEDIGRVGGLVLQKGIAATADLPAPNGLMLHGPKLISQGDAVGIVARGLGLEAKVVEVDEAGAVRAAVEEGVPEDFAKVLIGAVAAWSRGEGKSLFEGEFWEIGSANLRKQLGREPLSLGEWVGLNKAVLLKA